MVECTIASRFRSNKNSQRIRRKCAKWTITVTCNCQLIQLCKPTKCVWAHWLPISPPIHIITSLLFFFLLSLSLIPGFIFFITNLLNSIFGTWALLQGKIHQWKEGVERTLCLVRAIIHIPYRFWLLCFFFWITHSLISLHLIDYLNSWSLELCMLSSTS